MQRSVSKAGRPHKRSLDGDGTSALKDNKVQKLGKGEHFHCEYCGKNITDEVHIKCVECTNYYFCVDCFSVGVEIHPHTNSHDYMVMDLMDVSVFDVSWSANEERHLLEGIEMYGLGNWGDIAEHVGSKNAENVEHHYMEIFVKSKNNVPDMNVAYDSRRTLLLRRSQATPLLASNMGMEDAILARRGEASNTDLPGFMPLRRDFEFEYDNDAELMIRDVVFGDDDSPLDEELKISLLQIYNKKLDEREEKKKFCIEFGLLDAKRIQQMEKNLSKEEREVRDKCRPFARFFGTPDKYDVFVESHCQEIHIRKRIKELQEYRKNGITTLEGGRIFDEEKQRREEGDRALRKTRDYSSAGYVSERHLLGLSRNTPSSTPPNLTGPEYKHKQSSAVPSNAYVPPKIAAARRPPSGPIDISKAEGVELLSKEECQLCSAVRLLPKQYISIKATLMKEYTRLGTLKLGQARPLIRIDVNKTRKIYDFMVQQGWIKKPG
eukprot:Nk52_evm6s296 gene=Nk52_evmTU6s296